MQRRSQRGKMVKTSSSRSQIEQSKVSGGDQLFRKSAVLREYLARGEEHRDDLRGESDGSQPSDTMTERPETILGSKGITCVVITWNPRVKLYVPRRRTVLPKLRRQDRTPGRLRSSGSHKKASAGTHRTCCFAAECSQSPLSLSSHSEKDGAASLALAVAWKWGSSRDESLEDATANGQHLGLAHGRALV